MINNKSILSIGGARSFGRNYIRTIPSYFQLKKLLICSRDELKQFEMAQQFPNDKYSCMRYFIGDVRNNFGLIQALQAVEFV